ncbi:MAG: amidohydrolase, partial [Candidatus Bathyarchaeota archaeon]|nr:amidohydrolase [Candidatus Bathyarchaeota archaeon]
MDLITDPSRLNACKEEYAERTKIYMEKPLLPRDLEPPIDLPWPEYKTTVRGREWSVGPFTP